MHSSTGWHVRGFVLLRREEAGAPAAAEEEVEEEEPDWELPEHLRETWTTNL